MWDAIVWVFEHLFAAGLGIALTLLVTAGRRKLREAKERRRREAIALAKEKAQDAKIDELERVRVLPDQTTSGAPTAVTRVLEDTVIADQIRHGADILVVASGKGGVGKSTISLGLLEAYSSRGPTLLVDFDMHNRGLTSVFVPRVCDFESYTLMEELERFRKMYKESNLDELFHGTGPKEPDFAKHVWDQFKPLREKFQCFDDDQGYLRTLDIQQVPHPDGEDITTPINVSGGGRILPLNSFFLPSRKRSFLESPVFDASYWEVFFFLRCFAFLAQNPNKIQRIIVDCHGAHDLFMVGAILAANDLVIVSTPEPGSIDGTMELVGFAENLRKLVPAHRLNTVLTLNDCGESDGKVIAKLEKLYIKSEHTGFVTINSGADARDAIARYSLGSVANSRTLWPNVLEIRTVFDPPHDREIPQNNAPDSSGANKTQSKPPTSEDKTNRSGAREKEQRLQSQAAKDGEFEKGELPKKDASVKRQESSETERTEEVEDKIDAQNDGQPKGKQVRRKTKRSQ